MLQLKQIVQEEVKREEKKKSSVACSFNGETQTTFDFGKPRELFQDPIYKFLHSWNLALGLLLAPSFHNAFKLPTCNNFVNFSFSLLLDLPFSYPLRVIKKEFDFQYSRLSHDPLPLGVAFSFISEAFDWLLFNSSLLFLPIILFLFRSLLCNLLLSGDIELKLQGHYSNCDMSKLDEVVCHDSEESELISWNVKVTSDKNVNKVNEILSSIHQQGQRSISSIMTNAKHGTLTDRLFKGNGAAISESFNLPFDENGKRAHVFGRRSRPLLSGTAYCISSCSMILLNKIVLSSYNFNAGISLMFYQNLISCLVVAILGLCRAVSVEKLNWKLIKVWIPVNIIFVGMLVSGMYSLKYINIAMVTILKNMTNILTAIGEYYVFRKRQNQKVWTAMFMMIISAVTGGITDLSFDATGYAWQILNCILTASYSLTLRRIMDKAKQTTNSGSLNEVSMVLLNNLLSLPFAIFLIFILNEWEYVINVDVIKVPMFWVVATASGFLGLAISFTSIWFLHQTGPTTYSLVGSLNKIPISITGIVLFKVPLSVPNMFSILFGLFAGIFFARAKMS